MRYQIDNDLHVHTHLSVCSQDEGQTPAAILQHEKARGIKRICIADHYWDSAVPVSSIVNWWYEKQNFDHIAQSLPLPQDPEVEFLFGCETDTDSIDTVGVNKARWKDFGFISVSTTIFIIWTAPIGRIKARRLSQRPAAASSIWAATPTAATALPVWISSSGAPSICGICRRAINSSPRSAERRTAQARLL